MPKRKPSKRNGHSQPADGLQSTPPSENLDKAAEAVFLAQKAQEALREEDQAIQTACMNEIRAACEKHSCVLIGIPRFVEGPPLPNGQQSWLQAIDVAIRHIRPHS